MVCRDDFEDFLAEWCRSRVLTLSEQELGQLAESRGRELAELSLRAGYRVGLSELSKPYRSLADFVRALHTTPPEAPMRRPTDGRFRAR